VTRLFPIGLSVGAFAIALLSGSQPLFAAKSAALAFVVMVARHFYHSVEVR
jgi:hypothetical protein